MKKFAANYLVSEDGTFLKNGIVITTDDGIVVEIIDTKGDFREMAQLLFFNGILIANNKFVKTQLNLHESQINSPVGSMVVQLVKQLNQLTILDQIKIWEKIQAKFRNTSIPEILKEISNVLMKDERFSRQNLPGLFLLTGVDLPQLRFTAKSKLVKII